MISSKLSIEYHRQRDSQKVFIGFNTNQNPSNEICSQDKKALVHVYVCLRLVFVNRVLFSNLQIISQTSGSQYVGLNPLLDRQNLSLVWDRKLLLCYAFFVVVDAGCEALRTTGFFFNKPKLIFK